MAVSSHHRPLSRARQASSPSLVAAGLSAADLRILDGLGRRLASEIRSLIGVLPVEHRSVRSMAAYLEVNRNLCQRAIAAASSTRGGLDVVAQSPTTAQLLVLADACSAKRLKPSVVRSLRAVIEEVAAVAIKASGNEARLRADLRALVGSDDHPGKAETGEVACRKALFENASRLAGSCAEHRTGVGILWPSATDAGLMDLSMVAAYRGHVCREGGMPLTVYFHEMRDFESGDIRDDQHLQVARPRPQLPRTLLDRFCSSPLPIMRPQGPDSTQHQVVDPASYHGGRAIDIATLHQTRDVEHPSRKPDNRYIDTLMHMAIPVRRLVFDFYLHRSFARESIPFFGALAIGYGFEVAVRKAWYRQLPEGGQLELLGDGLRNSATRAWDRHAELVAHIFEVLNLDPSQAVGFRADIPYPVWGMTYAIGFDFSGAADQQPELGRPLPASAQ